MIQKRERNNCLMPYPKLWPFLWFNNHGSCGKLRVRIVPILKRDNRSKGRKIIGMRAHKRGEGKGKGRGREGEGTSRPSFEFAFALSFSLSFCIAFLVGRGLLVLGDISPSPVRSLSFDGHGMCRRRRSYRRGREKGATFVDDDPMKSEPEHFTSPLPWKTSSWPPHSRFL